jgi:hypothetical protein
MSFEVKKLPSEELWTGNSQENPSLLAGLIDPEKEKEVDEFVETKLESSLLLNVEKEKEKEEEKTPETEETKKSENVEEANELDGSILSVLNELSEDGVLSLYENHEIKTKEDLKLLIEDNIIDKLSEVNQNIFEERLSSLPAQFQSIIKYGLSGGTDVKSLLDSWAQVETTFNLDISTEAGQESAVREYLKLTGYGSEEMINQDIQTWKDLGKLEDKASLFKPKLEEYHMSIVAQKEQEVLQQQQYENQYQEAYTQHVAQALTKPELGGVLLDDSVREFLYENSQPIYQSQLTGKGIDALQAVVEELKFGQNANPEFYAELMLHATQPELYKERLLSQLKSSLAIEKERTLRKKVKEEISGNVTPEQKIKTQRPVQKDDWSW